VVYSAMSPALSIKGVEMRVPAVGVAVPAGVAATVAGSGVAVATLVGGGGITVGDMPPQATRMRMSGVKNRWRMETLHNRR